MEFILGILCWAGIILAITLIVKFWKLCDNVEKIANKLCYEGLKHPQKQMASNNNTTKKSNVIHLGDYVKLKGTSKEFKVVKITEDGYICDNYENKYLPKDVEVI